MHHFQFTKEKPAKVMVRNDTTDLEREITLVKDTSWRPNDFLKKIIPSDLSLGRHGISTTKSVTFVLRTVEI